MSELVAHQFDDLEQQTEADTLGMWTFLATEVLFFGGMICGYCVYRLLYFNAWHEGSLIVDNFRWLRHQQRRVEHRDPSHQQPHRRPGRPRGQTWATTVFLAAMLMITLVLGVAFLAIKAAEYTHEYHEGVVPGYSLLPPGQ